MKPIAPLLLVILMLAIPVAMSQNAEYWIAQTKSDFSNGSYSLALDDINQYLNINQSDTWGWNFRANLLKKMERYDEALESFDMVITLDPSNAQAYNDRALILSGAKNQDLDALASLETALQIDSLNANIWYNKGMILEKIGRYNQSLEAYSRATDLNEDLDRAWYRLGHVLMLTESYNESRASLEKAIELNSGNAEAWNDMGLVLRKLNRNVEARDSFRRAAQLDPSNSLYQQNLNGVDAPDMSDLPVAAPENIIDFSSLRQAV